MAEKESARAAAALDSVAEAPAADATPSSPPEAQHSAEPAEDAASSAEQFAAGSWNGHPRFKCPYCPHSIVAERDGQEKILQHIGIRHTRVQVSMVLGPDGKPVVKLESR